MYQRLFNMFLIVALFSVVLTAGQTGKITGTVVDQETSNPLPGVNVLLAVSYTHLTLPTKA